MQWCALITAGGLLGATLALPTEHMRYVIHEKRAMPSMKRRVPVDPDFIIPIRIALKQSNLHLGYDRLMEVSHPKSANYGKHLSPSEVHSMFAPTEDTELAVRQWLYENGIRDILSYENKGWLAVQLPARDAERLLNTTYFAYETPRGLLLGCDQYYLPFHVSERVDFIKPGIVLSGRVANLKALKREFPGGDNNPGWPSWPIYPGPGPFHMPPWPFGRPPFGGYNLPPFLQNCDRNMTPICIKALYEIPKANFSDPANRMGLFEFYDAFSQADLNLFFAHFAPDVPQGTHPLIDSIDGGTSDVPASSQRNKGESDTDIDLAYSIMVRYTYQSNGKIF